LKTDDLNKPYEFISKILVIVFAFLVISFVFGYYWLLLKYHSSSTSDLIVRTIETYYQSTENKPSEKETAFRKIAEILSMCGRSFLIVNENEDPVIWSSLPVNNDPASSLAYYKQNSPVPVIFKHNSYERRLYYIPDDLISKVRYYPFFLLGSIILIIFMTGYLYMFMRRNEKQSIWIAMSKETAHQLGTPLTSLNGWKEYISELSRENNDLSQLEEGLKDDIEKIGLIVERFSKFSSEKEFKMCDLKNIIEKCADYISKRITVDTDKISIIKKLDKVQNIYANSVLIDWTIENILKNSIESLKNDRKGEITIRLFEDKDLIIIEVSDNGSGIPMSIRKNIFDTGFTTKKRGWGLGLSLAKKVIEQYHKGSLFIKETSHEGTTFRIELNKYV